jgi:lysozyme family protein
MSAFDQAFAVLMSEEGGFTEDPDDPGNWTGGAIGSGSLLGTVWGLSAPVLAANFPGRDPRTIAQAEVAPVYQQNYWQPCQCDALPPPIALVVFDAAVNCGQRNASVWLQGALAVRQDGVIGPFTLSIARTAPWQQTVAKMLSARLVFMARLPSWVTFGAGWASRVVALAFKASALAG